MTTDTWQRAAAALWPDATVSRARRGQRPDGRVLREFVFVPNARRPKMLLPAGNPRAAAAALRRYSHDLPTTDRLVRRFASTALATGLPEQAFRDLLRVTAPASRPTGRAGESVESYLSDLLRRPVLVGLGLGTARANRKPVLHVLSADGQTVAFVKVGDSDVARELVGGEAATLTYLGGRQLRHLAVPEVLHHGDWRGLDLLVLSPLETTARRWQRRDMLPADAMAELFAVDEVRRRAAGDSSQWRSVREVPARLADQESAERLSTAIDRIGARYGDVPLDVGAWHGDWTPWNMAWRRSRVQLWDWERFASGVPWGFDALHYRLQEVLRSAGPADTSSLVAWAARAGDVLVPLGVAGPAARATTALYLLELCCRYLLAAQGSIGAPLRARAGWLLHAVHDHAGRL